MWRPGIFDAGFGPIGARAIVPASMQTVEVGDAVDADRSESATGTDRARKAEKARVHDAVLIRRAAVPKKKPPLLFGQRRLRICELAGVMHRGMQLP